MEESEKVKDFFDFSGNKSNLPSAAGLETVKKRVIAKSSAPYLSDFFR